MNIKATTTILFAFLCIGRLYAAEYSFTPDRHSSITLVTTTGKESITVSTWVKQTDSDRTIFESRLIPSESPSGDPSYKTPKGTLFTLKHLPKPVVNDANRNINSGD